MRTHCTRTRTGQAGSRRGQLLSKDDSCEYCPGMSILWFSIWFPDSLGFVEIVYELCLENGSVV